MKKSKSKLLAILPAVAKKVGDKSVTNVCTWWMCQPKVPQSMLKKDCMQNNHKI